MADVTETVEQARDLVEVEAGVEEDGSLQRDQSEVEAGPSAFDLGCPPPGTFPSREAVLEACVAFAAAHGFGVRIMSSKSDKIGVKRSYIVCCCEGKHVKRVQANVSGRVREKKTKRTGCSFRLRAMRVRSGPDWVLSHVHTLHNHPAMPAISFVTNRRRTAAQEHEVQALISSKLPPAKVIEALQEKSQDPILITLADVANARQKMRRQAEGEPAGGSAQQPTVQPQRAEHQQAVQPTPGVCFACHQPLPPGNSASSSSATLDSLATLARGEA